MSLKLRKQTAASVTTPDAAHDQIFVDENGNPSKKDSTGAVSSLVAVDGSPLILDKQSSDPTSIIAGQRGVLYAKQISGIVELFFEDDSGQVIQITNNGAIAGGVTGAKVFTPRWSDFGAKTGTPGEYWEDAETCVAQYGDSLMVDLSSSMSDLLTVTLPVMTAADAGKQIQVISVFDMKGPDNPGGSGYYYYQYYGVTGQVKLVPQTGDAILDCTNTGAAGTQRMNYWTGPEYQVHVGPWSSTLMADGNGRWVVSGASRVFANRADITYA